MSIAGSANVVDAAGVPVAIVSVPPIATVSATPPAVVVTSVAGDVTAGIAVLVATVSV